MFVSERGERSNYVQGGGSGCGGGDGFGLGAFGEGGRQKRGGSRVSSFPPVRLSICAFRFWLVGTRHVLSRKFTGLFLVAVSTASWSDSSSYMDVSERPLSKRDATATPWGWLWRARLRPWYGSLTTCSTFVASRELPPSCT